MTNQIEPNEFNQQIRSAADSKFPPLKRFNSLEEAKQDMQTFDTAYSLRTIVDRLQRGTRKRIVVCFDKECEFRVSYSRTSKRLSQEWMIVDSNTQHTCSASKNPIPSLSRHSQQTREGTSKTATCISISEPASRGFLGAGPSSCSKGCKSHFQSTDKKRTIFTGVEVIQSRALKRSMKQVLAESRWNDGDMMDDETYGEPAKRRKKKEHQPKNAWQSYQSKSLPQFPVSPVSESQKRECLQNFEDKVNVSNNIRRACAACGQLETNTEQLSIEALHSFREYLKIPEVYANVPAEFFRIDNALLSSMMLEREGFDYSESQEVIRAYVCGTCFGYLKRKQTPPCAYANNMWARPTVLPDSLRSLTFLEWKLLALSRPSVTILRLQSHTNDPQSRQRGYTGSSVSYPQPALEVLKVLPVNPEGICDFLRVTFIGTSFPDRKHTASLLGVRPSVVRSALLWLIEHNPLYKNVAIDEEALHQYENADLEKLLIDPLSNCNAFDGAEHIGYAQTAEPPLVGCTISSNGMIDTSGATDTHNDLTFGALGTQNPTVEFQTGVPRLFMPRSAIPHNEYEDSDLFARSYPELFPFGVGYPGAPRSISVTLQTHLQANLLHCSRAYGRHSCYMFHYWNMLQRRKSCAKARLQTRRKDYPAVVELINDITKQEIQLAIGKPKAEMSAKVKVLLEKVFSIGMDVPGSSVSLRKRRKEIQSLTVLYGPPHFFITLNPADIHSPLMLSLAGEKFDLSDLYFDKSSYRSRIVASDPVAQALYFDLIIEAIFSELLGFSRKDETGVLGPTEAFFGVFESQGRGSLHLHCLVWLKGRLNIPFLKAKIMDEDFQKRVLEYLEDTVKLDMNEEPPRWSDSNTLDEEIKVMTLQMSDTSKVDLQSQVSDSLSDIWTSQSSNYDPPSDRTPDSPDCRMSSFASSSEQSMSDCETSEIARPSSSIKKGNLHPSCLALGIHSRMTMDEYRRRCSLRLEQLLPCCQKHKHTPTCFKKGSHCRFLFPRRLYTETVVQAEPLKILQKRNNALVNNYNDFVLLALKANHDIQPLFTSLLESMSAMYYMTNYVTKTGPSTTNMLSLMASAASNAQEDFATLDPVNRTRRLIHRCYNVASNTVEFSAAHIASMALGLGKQGTHLTSNTFTPLYTKQYYDWICGNSKEKDEDDFVSVPLDCLNSYDEQSDEVTAGNARIDDFRFRPTELSEMCLYEHSMFMYNRSDMHIASASMEDPPFDPKNRSSNNSVRYQYMYGHPRRESDSSSMRLSPLVPQLFGPSIPHSDTDDQETYCSRILCLFKPWRTQLCLLGDAPNWTTAFQRWKESALIPLRIQQYIENLDALVKSKEDRDRDIKDRYELEPSNSVTADSLMFGDCATSSIDDEETFVEERTLLKDLFMDPIDSYTEDALSFGVDRGLFTYEDPIQQQEMKHCIMQATDHFPKLGDSHKQITSHWRVELKEQLKQKKLSASQDNEETGPVHPQIHSSLEHFPYIQLEEDFAVNHHHVQTLSDHFKLNEEQSKFFRNGLEYVLAVESSVRFGTPYPKQLLMTVLGPGGTGKSYIIAALLKSLEIYSLRHRVVVAAYTGTAANNIGGSTIHSLLGITGMESEQTASHTEGLRRSKSKKDWKDVTLLIIDEISMVGARFFHEISGMLGVAKEMTDGDSIFGGIGLILTGDFLQLEPIMDASLMTPSAVEKGLLSESKLRDLCDTTLHGTTGSDAGTLLNSELNTETKRKNAWAQHHGRMLWKSIDTVIFLHRLVRQQSDPVFGDLLGRLREGKLTTDDYALLNHCVVKNISCPSWRDAPFVVLRNRLRQQLNNKAVMRFAADRRVPLYAIVASDKIAGVLPSFFKEERLLCTEEKTGGICGLLYLCEGAPVSFTKNQYVELGITNGACAKVSSICLSTVDVAQASSAFAAMPHRPIILKELPEYIILDVRQPDSEVKHAPLANLKALEVPIFPSKAPVTLRKTMDGTKMQKSFTRTGFALCLGFAFTDYKVQGKSLDKMIADLVKPPRHSNSIHSLYVILSRVRTLAGLAVLRPFAQADIQAQLSAKYTNEMTRLKSICDKKYI